MSRFIIVVAILVQITQASCKNKQGVQSVAKSESNVVVVSIDTLRADYLKLYSSTGVETPNLEELAKQATVFKRVISQIPYTLPSHGTMLTGLYPVAHGVRDNVHDLLPQEIRTIAEIFQKQNYQTAGFIGSMVLSRATGLARGFQYYDDLMSRADIQQEDLGGIERPADEVLFSFQNWVEKRKESNYFFAFLHFYDPHSPYKPPLAFMPAEKNTKEMYKGEIRYVDSVLGKFFAFLRQKDLWNNTILLITSDHGEMLQEHGETGHGYFVYQPALEVPLILRIPGKQRGKIVPDIVELVDIAPTLLDLVGIQVPKSMQGETLLPLVEGTAKKKNRLAFSESYFASVQLGISPLRSVQDEKYKFIDAPSPELFELSSDPTESRNLAFERKSLADQLRKRVHEYQVKFGRQRAKGEERQVSAEEAEQFAALGYLSGNVAESDWDLSKDPKDYVDEYSAMVQATHLIEQSKYQEALPLLSKLLNSTGPTYPIQYLQLKYYLGQGELRKAEEIARQAGGTPQVLTILASIYERTGRIEKASEAYRIALEKKFSYFVLYNYVLFFKKTGRNQEALTLIQKVRDSRGDTEQARPILAEIYFLLEQWDEAEKNFSKLMEERPWEWKWYVYLSSVYQARGRIQDALLLLGANYERFSQYPEYLLRLGILYNVTGQKQREIGTFARMIQIAPEDSRPYFYLSKAMLESNQNPEEVIQLCLKGLQLNPNLEMRIFGHYILGNAYQLTGRPQESEKQFKLAQALEAKHKR